MIQHREATIVPAANPPANASLAARMKPLTPASDRRRKHLFADLTIRDAAVDEQSRGT
jgi:hypothetical protein